MKNLFIFLFWVYISIFSAVYSFASAILLEDAGRKYNAGDYISAMNLYLQVLTVNQDNQKAKKGLRETALKLLEKENQTMTNEPSQLMKEAKKALKEARKQKTRRNKEIKPIFKSAKDDYARKNYIWASNKFMDILLKYPDFEKAKVYYDKISNKMSNIANKPNFASFEQISYAKGYVAFQEQRFEDALCEWEKVLEINPEREEIKEQILKVKTYLKNAELIENEKKLEQLVKTTFEQGKADYDSKNWISCIKKNGKGSGGLLKRTIPKSFGVDRKSKRIYQKLNTAAFCFR